MTFRLPRGAPAANAPRYLILAGFAHVVGSDECCMRQHCTACVLESGVQTRTLWKRTQHTERRHVTRNVVSRCEVCDADEVTYDLSDALRSTQFPAPRRP